MIFHLYHQDIQSIVLVSLLLVGACYDFKCPVRSQRQQRSNNSCNIVKPDYMCLRDVFTFEHVEMCATKRHFQRPGYRIVWSGNVDGQVCNSQRYQPIRYFNSDGSDCILEKSVCNEEGQILVENGSPIRDRQCRCDYRRGYAFVYYLPNKCNCVPSIEDCSCYLKHCPKLQVLSPDYQCIWQDEIYDSMNCTRLLDCHDDIQEKKKTTSTKFAKTNSAGLFCDTPIYKERNCTVRIVYAIICLVILNGIAVIGLFVFIIHAWFQWKCLEPYHYIMRRRMASVAKDITSKITLNDGVSMPRFGLGVWRATPGPGGQTEQAVEFALQKGYRMIDTAEMYENEADVGRELKKSGLNREDVFIVTKLSENGYDRCKKIFKESLEKLDVPYIDLYLVHSPKSGKIIETYKAMLELKEQGLIRSVGVSNFGIQHLEGIKSNGLPVPSVNQIELHPWQQKPDIVKYCRDNNIAVMGYAPLVKGQRFDDETLCEISKRNNKSPAQILIRWSLQHGFITIPKSVHSSRIEENMLVFDWSLNDKDMAILDNSPDKSCKPWNPCDVPWTG